MSFERGFRRLFRIGRYTDRLERELDEEWAFHLDETMEELMEDGWERSDAEREARRRFGDEEGHRERIRAVERTHRRRQRGAAPWSALRDDVVSAGRSIGRAPGFAVAVVLTLALGIGANATMFTVVDRLLLSPPDHVVEADEVRRLYVRRTGIRGEPFTTPIFTYPDYRDLLAAGSFQSLAAFGGVAERTLGSGEGARRIRAVSVTASLFPLLGVQPRLGRFFGPEDDRPGAPGTAVLSEGFWRRELGADPGVLGRELRIGSVTYAVIGVAPRGFTGAGLSPVDVWLPLEVATEAVVGDEFRTARGWWMFNVVGRLGEDIEPGAAESESTSLHRAARAEVEGYDARAEILTSSLIAGDRAGSQDGAIAVSRWLAGVSLLVLLIACANVANLLLARAIRLRRELAVRVALGVSRLRLLQQLLVESFLLSGLAGGVALFVGYFGSGLVGEVLLPDVAFEMALGSRILVFIAVAVVLTTFLSGLLPAFLAARTGVATTLKEGSRGVAAGGSGFRRGLLVAQCAFSVLLLVGAGLFVRSLAELRGKDIGIDYRSGVVFELEPEGSEWGSLERTDAYRQAREAVARILGVEAVGLTAVTPLRMSMSTDLSLPGRDSLPTMPTGRRFPFIFGVDEGYFPAMGLDIVRGRGFERADLLEGAAPVAVVNETMARELWPGEGPLGECMYVGQEDEDGSPECTTVVGVVEDHPSYDVASDDEELMYYTALGRGSWTDGPTDMVVRASGPPEAIVPVVRRAVMAAVPGIRFIDSRTLASQVSQDLRSWNLGATLFSLFGLLALVVAGIGLYSALAFEVAQRRHELGIRSALGASSVRLVRLVAREALAVSVVGIGLGILASLALSPRIEDLLYRVSPRDPVIYLGVAAALFLTATAATLVPAVRATRVDPREALQAD